MQYFKNYFSMADYTDNTRNEIRESWKVPQSIGWKTNRFEQKRGHMTCLLASINLRTHL